MKASALVSGVKGDNVGAGSAAGIRFTRQGSAAPHTKRSRKHQSIISEHPFVENYFKRIGVWVLVFGAERGSANARK
jgi:hypothetical protein